jgi:hypothetical protein
MDESLTFFDKYKQCTTWSEKAICMALYHNLMLSQYPKWNLRDTATHFGISHGLCCENIKLAQEIDKGNKAVINAKTREEGLKHVEKRRYSTNRKDYVQFKMDDD